MSSLRVVAQEVGSRLTFYATTAHRYVSALLEATTKWLQRRLLSGQYQRRLGLSVELTYDDAAFYQDVWLAGHSPPALSCKA